MPLSSFGILAEFIQILPFVGLKSLSWLHPGPWVFAFRGNVASLILFTHISVEHVDWFKSLTFATVSRQRRFCAFNG